MPTRSQTSRFKRSLRIAGYTLLVAAIVLVTIVLVAMGRGYRFNLRTGEISGGGLLLLSSLPGGATVKVDDQQLDKSTPSRLSLTAGNFNVQLQRSGYRSWSKVLNVGVSEVTYAQYPLLVPENISTTQLQNLPGLSSFKQSPNRRRLAWSTGGGSQQLSVLDIGAAEPRSIYNGAKEQGTIETLDWSPDSNRLLLGLRTPQQLRYLVINVDNPTETIDLVGVFNLPLSGLQFGSRDWQIIYWPSPEGLRRLNLNDRTISAPLIPGSLQFTVGEDLVFGVQLVDNVYQLVSLDNNGQTKIIVGNLPTADYQLASVRYDDKRYLVALNKTRGLVSLYDATSESQQTIGSFDTVIAEQITISPDNRFLMMQTKNQFASYDFDLSRLHRFALSAPPSSPLVWLDNFHMIGTVSDQLLLFEFDGANQTVITETEGSFAAFASRDRRLVYSIGRSADGVPIMRVSKLILDN